MTDWHLLRRLHLDEIELVSVADAAAYLDVHLNTFKRHIKAGLINADFTTGTPPRQQRFYTRATLDAHRPALLGRGHRRSKR